MKTESFITLVMLLCFLLPHQTLLAQECDNIVLRVVGDIGDDNTVCNGSNITIAVDFDPDNCLESGSLNYSWSVQGADNEPSLEVNNIEASDTYSVTITDPNNMDEEVANLSIEITVLEPIVVSIDIGDETPSPICDDEPLFLEAEVMGSSGSLTYQWTGNGINGNSTRSVRINNPRVGAEYEVVVSDMEGCMAEAKITPEVLNTPTINISGDRDYCVGTAIDLTASASGGQNCVWTLPDGSTVQNCRLRIDNVQPANDIEYDVTVSGPGICDVSETVTVNVRQVVPTISPPMSVCENGTKIDLNPVPRVGSNRHSYMIIDENDIPLDEDQVDEIIVNHEFFPNEIDPGVYRIIYTAEFGGCSGTSNPITITVKEKPSVRFTSDLPDGICQNGTINLNEFVEPKEGKFFVGTDEITDGSLGPNDINSNDEAITIRYEVSRDGCENQTSATIDVWAVPQLDIGADRNVCLGAVIQLSVDEESNNNNSYEWEESQYLEGRTSKTPTVNAEWTTEEPSNLRDFTVTVTDEAGCESTGKQRVTVYEQPQASVIQDPIGVCADSQVELIASYTGGFGDTELYWDGQRGNDDRVFEIDSAEVGRIVNLEIRFDEENTGCQTATLDVPLLVQDTPEPRLTTTASSICGNQQTYFFVENRRRGSTFNWFLDETLAVDWTPIREGAALLVHWQDDNVGSTTVEVIESLGSGCSGEAMITVDFSTGNTVAPDPADIFLSPINNTLIYNDSSVDCYRWGYLQDTLVYLEEEVYQSYVTGQGYDPERLYFCQVWNGDCSDQASACSTTIIYRSNEVDQSPPQEEEEQEFVLFPNPNSGAFTVQANKLLPNTEYEIRIVNALGQQIKREVVVTTEDKLRAEISLTNAGAGVHYMILYLKGDLKEVRPFVVHAK